MAMMEQASKQAGRQVDEKSRFSRVKIFGTMTEEGKVIGDR